MNKDDIHLPKFEHFEQYAVLSRLKQVASDELEKLGITPHNIHNLINPVQVRNDIMRQEFRECRAMGIKAERLYCELSVKYDLSYDRIMDIIKKKL